MTWLTKMFASCIQYAFDPNRAGSRAVVATPLLNQNLLHVMVSFGPQFWYFVITTLCYKYVITNHTQTTHLFLPKKKTMLSSLFHVGFTATTWFWWHDNYHCVIIHVLWLHRDDYTAMELKLPYLPPTHSYTCKYFSTYFHSAKRSIHKTTSYIQFWF